MTKKTYQQCMWLALVFLLPFFTAAQGISPTNLQCEAKSDPLGLSETSPRLSWQDVAAPAGARGQYQTAYQIEVASLPQLLVSNQGDLWNTGQVFTNQTAQIVYAGSTLTVHQVCYWQVGGWDQNGQPSAWSSQASWSNVLSARHGNFGQLSYADGHAGKMKWLEPDTRKLQGAVAQSAEFNNRDKHQLWLSTYASGSLKPDVPW